MLFTKAKAVGDVRQVMAAGVRSYLPKDASAEQAKMAIRGLLNGDRYLPDDPNLNEPRNKSSGAESFLFATSA